MRNQPHTSPITYSSYENVRQGRAVYYNWLTPYNGNVLEKKKSLRPQPGVPVIGTFRVSTPNFEKESLIEPLENGTHRPVYTSLVLDNECLNMSCTELRVEDYYLLRTCGLNSDLYKIINNINKPTTFNGSLHTDFYKHQKIPLPNLAPPDLNRAYPLNANNGGLRVGNQLTGNNPFSQSRVNSSDMNFGSGLGLQAQRPIFGNNSNNNNNSGFLNQSKPFQTPSQNSFQTLPQSNNFSPPKTNAFQSLPPNNAFQSPSIANPPATGLMKSGQGQFQSPTDRLFNVLPNSNSPNVTNNNLPNMPLSKGPDNPLTNSTIGIPFQKNNQANTANAFVNIFGNNNQQGASNNMLNHPMSINSPNHNINIFNNSNNNAFGHNPNNNTLNNHLTNQNATTNNTSVINNNMTNNMYSQPTIYPNNTIQAPASNSAITSLFPS